VRFGLGTCAGQGRIRVEMSFLPDVYVDCEVCEGRRFNEETLDINYKGKTISHVLNLSMKEAADFFAFIPFISRPLQIITDLGPGYLTLGQPSPPFREERRNELNILKNFSECSRDW